MFVKRLGPFPTTHMQKQKKKENPNTSLYAVCCLIDLFKKKKREKVYYYKSLKRNMMNTIPCLYSPRKRIQPLKWSLLLQKCFKRIAWNICKISATCQSQLYSFRSLWGCLLHVLIPKYKDLSLFSKKQLCALWIHNLLLTNCIETQKLNKNVVFSYSEQIFQSSNPVTCLGVLALYLLFGLVSLFYNTLNC